MGEVELSEFHRRCTKFRHAPETDINIQALAYNNKMSTINTSDKRNLPASQRILLTAHELFYRHGLRSVGVDRLIAETGVTKATFYRHYPSKNDLIREYLEYRHTRWMEWFIESLQRNGNGISAIIPTLAEWFSNTGFRGCAFINSLAELGEGMPEVIEISRRHKLEMTTAILNVLPHPMRKGNAAQAIALAIDGVIIQVQMGHAPDEALSTLDRILESLQRE